ncbi:MAG: hypothetical protein HZA50_15245 [Planctomycetes bacterium]|nr:hypothetical protein [Planctomycetota bacterium]
MSYEEFTVGIWHPFGPHGLESPEQIILRKRQEIEDNGWTFWSFQFRRPEVLYQWSSELSKSIVPIVFCSNSPGARDPASTGASVEDCKSYRMSGQKEWYAWPQHIRVPHPFRGTRRQASAFIVERIVFPVEDFQLPMVEWFSKGVWKTEKIPTRGEYLIRRGGIKQMRVVRALLKLQAPYLATVSPDEASRAACSACD